MDTPTQTAAVTGNDNIVVLAKDSDVTIALNPQHPHLTKFERRTERAAHVGGDAGLLSAYRDDVVPLLGRDGFLRDLQVWLESPAPISMRVLTGPGGRDKTRLALALAGRISADATRGAAAIVGVGVDRARREAPPSGEIAAVELNFETTELSFDFPILRQLQAKSAKRLTLQMELRRIERYVLYFKVDWSNMAN